MPRTNVVGTTAPPDSGARRCAQADEQHITDSRTGSAATTACSLPFLSAYDGRRWIADRICHQCGGKPLLATTRRHARFCSPAHRAAYHRSSIAAGMARVRFPAAPTRDKAAPPAYIAIVADNRFPGMYRLKRSDGSLSDMVNLTRGRDALAQIRARP
jgi:hypothetical protein